MQISSALPLATTAMPAGSATATTSKSKPEDFLTDGDVKMIEYVSGTTSLAEAELNPNAKALAISLGGKRERGEVQGDVTKNYYYSQLTASDARMVENLTGTTNIIDALESGNSNVKGLMMDIALDRGDGSLTGDISNAYLNKMVEFDQTQLSQQNGLGISVNIETLNQALAYLKSERKENPTYSASA